MLDGTLSVTLIPTIRPTSTLAPHDPRHLWNYRTYITTLQYTCCTQTCNHFTTTSYKCQGQGKTRGQTGSSIFDQMLRLPGYLALVKPAETLARDKKLMVTSTITLLNTIYRRNIKWTATCITYSTDYYQRVTLESWFINLEQKPLNRSQQLPAPCKRLIDVIKQN